VIDLIGTAYGMSPAATTPGVTVSENADDLDHNVDDVAQLPDEEVLVEEVLVEEVSIDGMCGVY
jgi:mycofactocin precursor